MFLGDAKSPIEASKQQSPQKSQAKHAIPTIHAKGGDK